MKSFIVALALVAAVAADVSHILGQQTGEANAQILEQDADVFPDQFHYKYATSNGISAQESGVLKNPNSENAAISVQGSNAYTAPDGTPIQISYTADENGYQPQGAHLPVAPAPQPIPEYIQRAIEYIAAHPPKPETAGQIRY